NARRLFSGIGEPMFRVRNGVIEEEEAVLPDDIPCEPVAYLGNIPTHFIDSLQPEEKVRKFETGATRDTDTGKYDYEAFFSALVLERRAAFMHKNRHQKDGSLRDGDNWQKGIPLPVYMKSGFRHFFDLWKEHRGLKTEMGLEESICALMFNLEGYL